MANRHSGKAFENRGGEQKICEVYVKFLKKACGKPATIGFCRTDTAAPDYAKKDVVDDSALYDFPDVDYIWGLPIDVFHNGWEGLTKLKLVRMFINRSTKESRQVLAEVNVLYQAMIVFSESARTARPITQVLSLKGNELKVLTLTVFPVLATSIIRHTIKPW